MISLILILKRFSRVIRGGWEDREFRGLAIVLAAWVALGTIIYTVNEDWSLVESFYFCVMTLTTIGYGDFSPTGSAMQLHTVVYAVLGIGFFVAFQRPPGAALARESEPGRIRSVRGRVTGA